MNKLQRAIVLAEDSPVDAEMILEALGQAGLAHPVVHVEDGEECLDWLYCRGAFADRPPVAPALVMLDVKMPRQTGPDVLQQMRADERFRHTPVVMLSSSREQTDLERCWSLGVNAYVLKPVDVNEFFHTVQTLGRFWSTLNQRPDGD